MENSLNINDKYLNNLFSLLQNCEFIANNTKISKFEDIISNTSRIFENVQDNEKHAYFIGNGGSAAIATHFTADFFNKGQIKTISLYDSSLITCLSNDYGYSFIFSKQIERISEEGDILIAISSSGESPNIVKAVEAAKINGLQILSLTGFNSDNTVRRLSDYSIYVPSSEYGYVESIHNIILQQVVDVIGA